MADKSRSEKFYGKGDKGGDKKGSDKKPDKKADKKEEHPHVAERAEAFSRHAKAREDLHKQQEAEIATMMERHATGAQGNEPAPAAGPAASTNGAAPGTPAAVASA